MFTFLNAFEGRCHFLSRARHFDGVIDNDAVTPADGIIVMASSYTRPKKNHWCIDAPST